MTLQRLRLARGSPVLRYGVATGAVLAAAAAGALVRPITNGAASPLFVAAVILSSWLGGIGAGLLATVLAVLALDAEMSPAHISLVLNADVLARLSVFVLVAVFIGVLDLAGRRAEAELARAWQRERQARAEAEAANRAKDDFVAMVAHELRTPLTAAAAWAAALDSGRLEDRQRAQALGAIQRNVAQQVRIVDDLVDLSRLTRGQLSLQVARVDLRDVIAAAAEAMTAPASARAITLALDLVPACPWVAGDPARLQQVVSNLLANAIRHSEPGGTVSIQLDTIEAHARIRVCDTGCGIAPEFLPHVFDRYRQAGGEHARPGLGLGLTIVRELVDLHHGQVAAASPGVGQGACFTVLLPSDR